MIKRIVKMTFRPEELADFLKDFESIKGKIRNRKGCQHLELWQDVQQPHIVFTYSFWESEDDLNAYRHSDLFAGVWKRTKARFLEKAAAWSVDTVSMA